MTDILEPILDDVGFAPATERRPTRVRVQLTIEFPRDLGQNARLEQLVAANRRLVRSAIADFVERGFPRAWRDAWDARLTPVPTDGHLPDREALQIVSQALSDPRVLPDAVPDKKKYVITYNVHDDVQCASVKVPLRKKSAPGLPLEHPIPVSDPALPGGRGRIHAVLFAELKWEVPLGDVRP